MSSPSSPATPYDVLILGASMAGVEVLYQLRKKKRGRALRIAMVDRQEVHGYIPLVQERLSHRLHDGSSRLHTGGYVTSSPNVEMIVGTVERMNSAERRVFLDDGRVVDAAVIVVALGSVVAPPVNRIPGIDAAVGVKFDRQAQDVRERLQRLRAPNGPEQPRVVVVGGGISGVEMAGELAWMSQRSDDLQRPFEVTLVHSGERLLPALCERAGVRAVEHLEAQGVDLRMRARIVEMRSDGVVIEDHVPTLPERLDMPTDLVVWAGGVRPSPILGNLGIAQRDGWLVVDPQLRALDREGLPIEGVFVAGDAACVVENGARWPTMKRAIECLWQGKIAARNVLVAFEGGRLETHRLREDFPHGVSIGGHSLVVFGPLVLDMPRINTWFRRFLMRRYFARYGARSPD